MTFPSISTAVIVTVIFGLWLALLRRPWTAAAISGYLIGFALLGSWVKEAYLGLALTVADVYFFLLRPVENFKLFLNYPLLGIVLLSVIFGAVVCILVGLRFERPMRIMQRPKIGNWVRLAVAVVALSLGASASVLSSNESQSKVNDGDAYAAFLAMYEMQHVENVVQRLNVFFNNRSIEATMPALHEQTRFSPRPIKNENSSGANDANNLATSEPVIQPDIFLILEESTFDTTLLRNCQPMDCDNDMLHPLSIATRTQQGPLLVHTTGGGTWLAEFAVMSGLDWRLFGRGGAFAPVSLAPRLHVSLPMQLKALGYRTIGIYPTDGNFLSARSAYEYYGFEEFYDARELHLPQEWGDIRDSMVFDKALESANKKPDKRPIFLFALTIRNHGPHGDTPRTIPAAFKRAIKDTSVNMADYLARTRDSSTDFVRLAGQWLKSSRPRVLAWFGDHQPEAAWDFTEHPELLYLERTAKNAPGEKLKYLTLYQFSANFGAPEKLQAHEAMDITYLGAELLAFSGLPLDDGGTAALEVNASCHGLMLDCADHDLINDYLAYRIYQLQTVR